MESTPYQFYEHIQSINQIIQYPKKPINKTFITIDWNIIQCHKKETELEELLNLLLEIKKLTDLL